MKYIKGIRIALTLAFAFILTLAVSAQSTGSLAPSGSMTISPNWTEGGTGTASQTFILSTFNSGAGGNFILSGSFSSSNAVAGGFSVSIASVTVFGGSGGVAYSGNTITAGANTTFTVTFTVSATFSSLSPGSASVTSSTQFSPQGGVVGASGGGSGFTTIWKRHE